MHDFTVVAHSSPAPYCYDICWILSLRESRMLALPRLRKLETKEEIILHINFHPFN